VGLLDGLVVSKWCSGVDPTLALDSYVAALRMGLECSPKGVYSLALIDPSRSPDGMNEAAQKIYTEFGSKLLGVACVIEATGFRAAMFHAALSVIGMTAPCKTMNFKSVAAAAKWLVSSLPGSALTAANITAAVEQTRASISPTASSPV